MLRDRRNVPFINEVNKTLFRSKRGEEGDLYRVVHMMSTLMICFDLLDILVHQMIIKFTPIYNPNE
jgi:hypothetical protein